jgi:hypothetical protein
MPTMLPIRPRFRLWKVARPGNFQSTKLNSVLDSLQLRTNPKGSHSPLTTLQRQQDQDDISFPTYSESAY